MSNQRPLCLRRLFCSLAQHRHHHLHLVLHPEASLPVLSIPISRWQGRVEPSFSVKLVNTWELQDVLPGVGGSKVTMALTR